jgi:hypothetical protein
VKRAPAAAALAAALGLAVQAPAAVAQDPAAMLEAMPAVPANPPESVVSEQYREIEVVVREALPAAAVAKPAAPPVAPAAPPVAPKPEYQPEREQYHSEQAPDVTVTQQNPQNVNVSIRINSPGDDGPVTQTNNAVVVPTPAKAEPPSASPGGSAAGGAPNPAAVGGPPAVGGALDPAGAMPDTWEWVWTSACFGGDGGPAAAAASARWVWRWSCGADVPAALPPNLAEGLGALPAADTLASWPSMPAAPPEVAELLAPLAGEPPAAARPKPERGRSGDAAGPASRERPPPAAVLPLDGGAALAAPLGPRIDAARAAAHARPAAQARPRATRRAAGLSLPSGADGPAAGPASGFGGAASLLLAGWIAVLLSALGLVLPRLWLRRWTGPAWRLPWPRGPRLERPG